MSDTEEGKKKSGFATAGLVLGIIALCTAFIPIINNLSFALAIIGGIFALISLIKKASVKKSIITIIICVIACALVVNLQNEWGKSLSNLTGDNTEEILKNNVEVTFGEVEVKTEYGYSSAKLPVTVKNIGNETKNFSIQIEALDSAGNRIESDTIYVNNLGAGQSAIEEAFKLVTSDNVAKLQNATFKVASVSMY